ncbi:MAG: endonuclease [Flavobacteriales bacterium]|nr:endonuclease [Flavobacteriales bacterium]
MKTYLKIAFIVLFLLPIIFFGQIPPGYYNGTSGLTGQALKFKLHDIISANTNSLSYSDLWTAYNTTDKKSNGKVWDMYSDLPGGTPPYSFTFSTDQCGTYNSEADCYNREHSVPASWFNDAAPMYTDLFHVVPTDGYVNNRRSNYPFGEVGSVSWTSQNGSKLGTNTFPGYVGTVFEPIDSFKGDFARIYFYMATRYKDEIPSWSSPSFSTSDLTTWTKNMMLEWNSLDPVSQKEVDRNNSVYTLQNNRNPYVDSVQWINEIWGYPLNAVEINNSKNYFVFPNPTTDILNLNLDNIQGQSSFSIFSTDGKLLLTEKRVGGNHQINVKNFERGLYFLVIENQDKKFFEKILLVK